MYISKYPSIFESFNARALEPDQVARTFVPPRHYHTLTKRSHSIVIGPRGSGKTTLLKMLQQPALESWQHPDADRYRSAIDFTGVFIATDVSWGRQVQSLGYGKLTSELQNLFGTAAFTTHVLRSLVIAMLHRTRAATVNAHAPYRRLVLEERNEVDLVRSISRVWRLTPTLPSLVSLKHALSERLVLIREQAGAEAYGDPGSRDARLSEIPYLHLHFLDAVLAAIELFGDATNEHRGRWALLFDELEMAPARIRQQLLQSLRSTDSRILLKLSMSAYAEGLDEIDKSLAATPDHDYDTIPLWYAHKEEGYQFCRELWDSMVRDKGLDGVTPEKLLGSSGFETSIEEWSESGNAYGPNSRIGRRFVRMAKSDQSFLKYLQNRGISPDDLRNVLPNDRAADLRKVAPILAVREAYRTKDEPLVEKSRDQRSRKNPDLYTGSGQLFAMVEGNPRWFIGIMGRLLGLLSKEDVIKLGGLKPISKARQVREIDGASPQVYAPLKAIPWPAVGVGSRPRSFLEVLNAIGGYIFDSVVRNDFTPDPPGSFIVDSTISSDMHESLTRALNAGAIVYVPDEDGQLLLASLRGKRFRLSYLLAPTYHVPLRLGRAVSLSKILNTKMPSSPPPKPVPKKETPLFPED